MDNKTTGRFIADCRKVMGYTQNQLAEKIGVTDKAISKWETGKGAPDISFLMPLAEALNVSVIEILNGRKIQSEKLTSEADLIVTDLMEKTKYRFIKGVFWAVVIFVVLMLINPLYHYMISVQSTDLIAIEEQANQYINQTSKNYGHLQIDCLEKEGNYTAALLYNETYTAVVIFERDSVFEDRISYIAGGISDNSEMIGLFNSGSGGMNVNVFYGANLPDNIASYSYTYDEGFHVYPVIDNKVLDLRVDFADDGYAHPIDWEVNYK